MKKKKLQLPKSTAKRIKRLKKNKRLLRILPLLTLIIGIGVGLLLAWFQPPDVHPKNMVWAADQSVKIPGDLAEFLQNQEDCQGYRGTNTPRGVGLWGVYQTSQDKFAKISWGCSTHLSSYIMAVKKGSDWKLLQPTEYFANKTAESRFLPNCSFVDQYHIDETIEPYCIEPDGSARENNNK